MGKLKVGLYNIWRGKKKNFRPLISLLSSSRGHQSSLENLARQDQSKSGDSRFFFFFWGGGQKIALGLVFDSVDDREISAGAFRLDFRLNPRFSCQTSISLNDEDNYLTRFVCLTSFYPFSVGTKQNFLASSSSSSLILVTNTFPFRHIYFYVRPRLPFKIFPNRLFRRSTFELFNRGNAFGSFLTEILLCLIANKSFWRFCLIKLDLRTNVCIFFEALG